MASVVLGFAFDDGSFFNSSVPVGTWHHLQNHLDGNFYSLQFASQEASRRGITLTSQNLVQIAEGGMALSSGQPVQERVLYQSAVPPQCPPPAVNPPPHHSFEAVPGPSSDHGEGGLQVLDEAMPVSWTQPAVLLLIEEVRSHQHLFSSNAFKKNQVWSKVSTAVNRRGYSYSGFACDKKWRSLNTRFRTIKDKNSKTGQSRTSWAYYDVMQDVNAGNPAVNPPVRISSGGGITVTRSPSEGRSLSVSPETTQSAEGLPRVSAMQVTRSPSEGRSLSVSPETTQSAEGLPRVSAMQVTRSPSEGRSLSVSPETTQPAEGLPRVPAMQENHPQPDGPGAVEGQRPPASDRALLFKSPKMTSRKRKRQEPEPPAWLKQFSEQNSAHMQELLETARIKNCLLQRMMDAYEKEKD